MFTILAVICSLHRDRGRCEQTDRLSTITVIIIMMTFSVCATDNLSFQLVDRDINLLLFYYYHVSLLLCS